MKELTKNEQYCMEWFRDRGYEIEVKKKWNSKTVFTINGKGFEDFPFELISGIEDIQSYMDRVEDIMNVRMQTRHHSWKVDRDEAERTC